MFSWQINPHIQLELLELQHAEDLFRLTDQNRTYLKQWLPWVDEVTKLEDTCDFIQKSQKQRLENNNFQAAIRVEKSIAGMIGHHKIDWQNSKTSLGYWLGKSYQGRGIMTKCCAAVVSHAFQQMCLHRVEIHCAANNKKSRGIPERLGFIEEAILREAMQLNGAFVDRVIYRMLASDWGLND
ncbi:MAG: GNAT family N-acetyltransferase [Bacteroidota bacterium]